MTHKQLAVRNAVLAAVRGKKSQLCMIDAKVGTGKAFTEEIIAARLLLRNILALIVASSDIAAPQLPGGWTPYSMFRLLYL